MNRITTLTGCLKTLACLFLLVHYTGGSHLAKIYSRLNQDPKRTYEANSEKNNYPLDKLMNRLGFNSSREVSTPSNLINYGFDRLSRSHGVATSAPSIEAPNSVPENALWKRRSVPGQKPRVTREETKDAKRKKVEASFEKRYDEDSEEDEDDEDEVLDGEHDNPEYPNWDSFSYESDHRNVRHGASHMKFQQSEPIPHQRTNQQMSEISRQKWEYLGTPEAVAAQFLAHTRGVIRKPVLPDPYSKKQAMDHILKINNDGKCKLPKLKLFKLTDFHSNMAKTYFPSCILLHRCGQDTGCCPLDTQKCTNKSSTTVEFYFTTIKMGPGEGGNSTEKQGVEKLHFINDTECHCVEIEPRDMGSARLVDRKLITGCNCPAEFSARYMPNGSCTCDCFDKQIDCLRYKRGLKYFEHKDRLCIAEGSCEKPLCRFGTYEHKYGRCPKKHEKFQKFSKYHY